MHQTSLDMARFFHLIAVLALTAISVNALGSRILLLQPISTERPAGCHQHSGNPAVPQPSSSQCCLIGHDTAVTQAAHSVEPTQLGEQVEPVGGSLIGSLAARKSSKLVISSVRPPGITPLRI
jgi:hypothetical protein